jgi:hypothetical protein
VTVPGTDFVPMRRQAVTNRAKGATPGNFLWITVRLPVLVHLHQASSSAAGDPAPRPRSVSSVCIGTTAGLRRGNGNRAGAAHRNRVQPKSLKPDREERGMATEFILGARASCSDGPCGEVIRTILGPAAKTVTHLVIQPGHHAEDGRLVPVGFVEPGAGEIRLPCSLAEFGRLDPAEDIEMVEGLDYGGGYGPGAVTGYGNVGSMGVGASASGRASAWAWAITGRVSPGPMSQKVRAKPPAMSASTPSTARSAG